MSVTRPFNELREILPGFGAFGAVEPISLSVEINAAVDSVHIGLLGAEPQYLNILAPKLYGSEGKLISLKELSGEVHLSSQYGSLTQSQLQDRFASGGMLHSKAEIAPYLVLKFEKPVHLQKIEIPNRADIHHRRTRNLVLRWFKGNDCIGSYDNLAPQSLIEAVDAIAALLNLSAPISRKDLVEACLAAPRETLQAIPMKLWLWSLPVFGPSREPDDFEALCMAMIVLKLMGEKETETRHLKFLGQQFLKTGAALEKVRAQANRIVKLEEGVEKEVVFSKHLLHFSRLSGRKESYLHAIEELMRDLRGLGAQALLCYGTLLGARRSEAFLPHDDDVDLLYLDGSQSREMARASRERIIDGLKKVGYRVWDTGENFSVTKGVVSIDLFYAWEEGEDLHLMMEGFKYRTIPKKIVLPPSGRATLYGQSYPAPAQVEAFLAERYGPTWSIEDRYYEWPWQVEG